MSSNYKVTLAQNAIFLILSDIIYIRSALTIANTPDNLMVLDIFLRDIEQGIFEYWP